VRAVGALRVVRRRQPEEHDDGVDGARNLDRLGEQSRVLTTLDLEARREADSVAEQLGRRVERGVDARRHDLRAALALEQRRPRELADQADGSRGRVERQDPAVVLQQHRGLERDALREAMVRVEVDGRVAASASLVRSISVSTRSTATSSTASSSSPARTASTST
jgi:hypothetical protein